jgi:hypothetical protein
MLKFPTGITISVEGFKYSPKILRSHIAMMEATSGSADNLTASAVVVLLYFFVFVLYTFLPGRVVKGYCCEQNVNSDGAAKEQDKNTYTVLTYRLNGFTVFVLLTAIYCSLPQNAQRYLYTHYWTSLITANAVGLCISAWFYLAPHQEEPYARCVTTDQLDLQTRQVGDTHKLVPASELPRLNAWDVFYLGRKWNPRLSLAGHTCDIKMLFYTIGAIMLWLNILAAASMTVDTQYHNTLAFGWSNAMCTYVFCFGWFIAEYLLGEEGLNAEKIILLN